MKKYVKLVPTMVLAMVAAVGCGEKPAPAPVDNRSALAVYIEDLPDGELSSEQISGLLAPAVFSSADNEVKFSEYYERSLTPRSAYTEAAEQYITSGELVIQDLTRRNVFKSFDNGVVVTDKYYEEYPYDVNQKVLVSGSPENDSFALVPTKYHDKASIWKDSSSKLNYVFDRDNSSSNPYSCKASKDDDGETMEKAAASGALTSVVLQGLSDAKESYSVYVDEDSKCTEVETAVKNGNEINFTYLGKVAFYELYSAKLAGWGDEFAGYYVEMGYSFYTTITIKDNFVTNAKMGYIGIYRILFEDTAWKPGDPDPADVELTEKEIAALRPTLVVASTYGRGSTEPNPYSSAFSYMSMNGVPANFDTVTQSKYSLGEFDMDKLPSPEDYREADFSDFGSDFFSIEDFLGE